MLHQIGDAKEMGRLAAARRKAGLLGAFRRAVWELSGRPDLLVMDADTARLAGSQCVVRGSLFAAGAAPVAYFDDDATHALSPQGRPAAPERSAQLLARKQLGRCLRPGCPLPREVAPKYIYDGEYRPLNRPSGWCREHYPRDPYDRKLVHAATRRTADELLRARGGDLSPVRTARPHASAPPGGVEQADPRPWFTEAERRELKRAADARHCARLGALRRLAD
jgi:hypothetical protein